MTAGKEHGREEAHPKRRAVGFNWLRGLLYAIGTFLVLAVALLLLAGTGPVLRLAMPRVEQAVSKAIDGSLATGDIRGSLWTGLTVDSLALAVPATGLAVKGNGLELQWAPLALLKGTVQIDRLAAENLAVTLPHIPGPETPERPAEPPPALPLAIRLKQLDLPHIDIADPRSGKHFLYALSASGAVEKRAAELSLNLVPREGLDRLVIDLAFDADRQELRAEIDGYFHRAGLVMTLAGLPPEEATDTSITLKGEGPADKWQGDLRIAATDLAGLAGNLGLQLDRRQLGLTFFGNIKTLGQLAAELPAQLQGTAEIGLTGRYEMEAERLAVTKLDLAKADLLTLSAGADFDLAANRLTAELQARIDPAASGLLQDAEGAVAWQGLELSGKAEGDLSMPALDLKITGTSVTTPVLTSRDLSLTVTTKSHGDRLAVEAAGTASGNEWREAELTTILGDRLDLALNAVVAADFRKMAIDKLTLEATGLQLTGRGGLDEEGAVTAADLAADIDDLADFSALAGMELRGAGRLAVTNGSWNPAGGGRAGVEISLRELALGQPDLDRVVGSRPAIAGILEMSPNRDLTLELTRVDLAMADGEVSLAFADGFTGMHLSGELAVLPGALPPAAGIGMPQAARLTVGLDGPPQAPAGEISLTVPTLEAGGERFDKIAATSTLQWSDEAVLSLLNRAEFTLRGKTFQLLADVALPPDRLQLSRLALDGGGLELAGQLELPGYEPPMKGAIDLVRLDAGLLQDWEVPLAAGQVAGKVDFVPEKAQQRINIDLTAKGLRLAGGASQDGLEHLAVRGQVADAFHEPAVELQLTGTKIAYAEALLSRLQATLRGPLSNLRATVETAGRFQAREPVPVSLSASANMNVDEDMRVEVGKLTAAIGTEKISLQRPLRINRTGDAVDGSTALAVGAKGLAEGSFRLVPGQELAAQADLSAIALDPWDKMFTRQGLTGLLSLSATVSEQAGEAVRARISASIDDIRLVHAAQSAQGKPPRLPPLSINLTAGVEGGRLDGNLTMEAPERQMMTARATLPLTMSILAGQYGLDHRAPLTAQADIDSEIGQFWPYVPLPDHSLAGRLKLTAALSGSMAEPALEGTVQLAEGRYEHLQFGTLLKDIRAEGSLDSRGIHITEIAANDGGKGNLTGKAEIEIGGRPFLGYRAELVMRDMAVTRMDELQLFGDIDLNVTGDDRSGAIRGEATVNRGEVDLAVAFPPSVPQLEVANLPQPGETAGGGEQGDGKKEEKESFAADLHLTVDIPGRLFVRGKGLDSEWGGRLEVTGPAAEPTLVGELRARRGQLEVLGTTFAISDSQITFLGGQPPDPQLDIVGVHNAGDLEVKANLTGTASKSKLTLSSEPQLPQDEILSRIVFGKSQGKLSPYEAVQLAGVAAELTGTTEGFDILGSFRKLLRVDVLRVGGGEDGPQVEVGKYLTEGVYVGTKRGTTTDSSGVEVEIELSPHVKATSESNEIDNKAGLQFKWDY